MGQVTAPDVRTDTVTGMRRWMRALLVVGREPIRNRAFAHLVIATGVRALRRTPRPTAAAHAAPQATAGVR